MFEQTLIHVSDLYLCILNVIVNLDPSENN
jgi:hypothetical protein